jgi:hypothetical protein
MRIRRTCGIIGAMKVTLRDATQPKRTIATWHGAPVIGLPVVGDTIRIPRQDYQAAGRQVLVTHRVWEMATDGAPTELRLIVTDSDRNV